MNTKIVKSFGLNGDHALANTTQSGQFYDSWIHRQRVEYIRAEKPWAREGRIPASKQYTAEV